MDLYRERAEKYRTPSIEFSAQFEDFEETFPYEPTPDQDQCFQVRLESFILFRFSREIDWLITGYCARHGQLDNAHESPGVR